jgi:hypothetical protein
MNRREFLRLTGAASAWLLARPHLEANLTSAAEAGAWLCRVTEPKVSLHSQATPDSPIVGEKVFDDVLTLLRRKVGWGVYPHNHVWFETPEGYLWSSYAQPVRQVKSTSEANLPPEGVWTEVCVPFVDGRQTPDIGSGVLYRLYYAMILNVDGTATDPNGVLLYQVHDEHGVVMYAPAEAFRILSAEEASLIHPNVEGKEIRVNLSRQDLSAFEGSVEVYYCRVASGYALLEGGVRQWNTPVGTMHTWRKMISAHMSGGDRVSGYDLPGVGWTILFHGSGAAVHSTYWHNDFGTPRSRGCINVAPEDARWLFRWSDPPVSYRPGDVTLKWPEHGTRVIVTE